MKKNFILLIMVLPFLLMFFAYGVGNIISLPFNIEVESLTTNYDAYEETGAESPYKLHANIYPTYAANAKLIWSVSPDLDTGETIAEIVVKGQDSYLVFNKDSSGNFITGRVCVSVELSGGRFKQSFEMFGIGKETTLQKIFLSKSDANSQHFVVGKYNLINGEKQLSVESNFKLGVIPKNSSKEFDFIYINSAGEEISEQESVATFDKDNLSITVKVDGKFGIRIVSQVDKNITFDYHLDILDAVNVFNYQDLLFCTNKSASGEAIVLRKNLGSLAEVNNSELKNYALFGELSKNSSNGEIVTCEHTNLPTTYDWKFYENQGLSQPEVIVGITFKQNLYGNGFTLNAHELAFPSGKDTNKKPLPSGSDLFKSPLAFVGAANMKVYGQDNIGFLVKGDGILIDNVSLKNCSNVSDLTHLDYVGTVLEIIGDNCKLTNSTVSNGRTVIRSFSNDNFTIDNCLLQYAREFILKVGSNSLVRSTMSNLYPTGNPSDSSVIICDTQFYKSGMFCIAIDAHFSGSYICDGMGGRFPEAIGLGATSSPTIVTIKGDTKFFDWKAIDSLDSSTLITGAGENAIQLNEIFKMFKSKFPVEAKNVFKVQDGKDYVHGGIAFFGGGRNDSTITFEGNVDSARGGMFYLAMGLEEIKESLGNYAEHFIAAAGREKFRFLIYNSAVTDIVIDSIPTQKGYKQVS
ncbi:MAG: hypothetical protein RR248_01430 [Clostridia bacterium]